MKIAREDAALLHVCYDLITSGRIEQARHALQHVLCRLEPVDAIDVWQAEHAFWERERIRERLP